MKVIGCLFGVLHSDQSMGMHTVCLSAMSQTIACLEKETCFQQPQTLKASRLNEMKVMTHHECAASVSVKWRQ